MHALHKQTVLSPTTALRRGIVTDKELGHREILMTPHGGDSKPGRGFLERMPETLRQITIFRWQAGKNRS